MKLHIAGLALAAVVGSLTLTHAQEAKPADTFAVRDGVIGAWKLEKNLSDAQDRAGRRGGPQGGGGGMGGSGGGMPPGGGMVAVAAGAAVRAGSRAAAVEAWGAAAVACPAEWAAAVEGAARAAATPRRSWQCSSRRPA